MYPILFSYKFITIGGYGLMLGLAFYLGFLVGEREFIIRGKDPELAYRLLLSSIPSAIVGAKIFHILDYKEQFMQDKWGVIFSGSGLSVYGGLIFALIAAIVVIRLFGENVLEVFDASCPTIALGYGIGRFGCHFAGDECYGITTSSFFGTAYPNGIAPATAEVLPTALFESLCSFIILFFILAFRKREMPAGKVFFVYLMLNGATRFFVEFVRINPKIFFWFTQAQLIALLLVATGFAGLLYLGSKSGEQPA